MISDEQRAKREEAAKAKGRYRATPTPEELDLRAMGVPNDEIKKQPDGSPLDKHVEQNRERMRGENTRDMRPRTHGPGYETR
jgi:hypothetical protein